MWYKPKTYWPSKNDIKERLIFWPWDTRNKWKSKYGRTWTRFSFLNRNSEYWKTKTSKSNGSAKCWKLKHHKQQHQKTNVNSRIQNKCRIEKENHDWKEDFVTSLQEPRLEKSQDRKQNNKQIITKYSNEQHHKTKCVNLCKCETSLW